MSLTAFFQRRDQEGEAYEFDPPDCRPLQDTILVEDERRSAVARAIATLPDKYRAPLVLRDVEGHSYDEIARILEMSEGTVKSRINRARAFLRTSCRRICEEDLRLLVTVRFSNRIKEVTGRVARPRRAGALDDCDACRKTHDEQTTLLMSRTRKGCRAGDFDILCARASGGRKVGKGILYRTNVLLPKHVSSRSPPPSSSLASSCVRSHRKRHDQLIPRPRWRGDQKWSSFPPTVMSCGGRRLMQARSLSSPPRAPNSTITA